MGDYRSDLKKSILEYYANIESSNKVIYEYNDKFIVWIVGLSTATIALIIGYGQKIPLLEKVLNSSLALLALSIISGISSRVLLIGVLRLHHILVQSIKFDLIRAEPSVNIRDLSGYETEQHIAGFIKEDFGEDMYSDGEYVRMLNSSIDRDYTSRIIYQMESEVQLELIKDAQREYQAYVMPSFFKRKDKRKVAKTQKIDANFISFFSIFSGILNMVCYISYAIAILKIVSGYLTR